MGTGQRDVARNKVFISKNHEKHKCVINSPGPVYSVPSTVGDAPCPGFGTSDARYQTKAKYPDSSVDLNGALVDSQKVKYPGTSGVHFGTEQRGTTVNAEVLRTNPSLGFGLESPGGLEYRPDESKITALPPAYSFGLKKGKNDAPTKPCTRLSMPPTSSPRHVGPGSNPQPGGLGNQPQSTRPSQPSWTFSGSTRKERLPESANQLIDTTPIGSSFGKQVHGKARSSPRAAFGTSTREHSAKTQLAITEMDRGPIQNMPTPRFIIKLPPASARSYGGPGM
jgi:hypothetical protein